MSEATWLVLIQAALVACVPMYLAWQAHRTEVARLAAEEDRKAADSEETTAKATDIVTKTALGMLDPLERRLKLVEGEARNLRGIIVALEQTVREQAILIANQAATIREQSATIKEQQCRIDQLILENSRMRAGIDLLTRQVLQLGAKPAFPAGEG